MRDNIYSKPRGYHVLIKKDFQTSHSLQTKVDDIEDTFLMLKRFIVNYAYIENARL